jgi:endonuclease YncB( thermonuclease family)
MLINPDAIAIQVMDYEGDIMAVSVAPTAPKTFGPYPAKVVAIHDGDTVTFDIDLGFDHMISGLDWNGKSRLSCRVYGINAPELSTPAGKIALAFALTIIHTGDICQVVSHGWDKYGGRFDGDILLPDGRDFGAVMIASGNAVVFL